MAFALQCTSPAKASMADSNTTLDFSDDGFMDDDSGKHFLLSDTCTLII